MSTPNNHGGSSFNQATPKPESPDPIDSLTDCLRRCTATGDFQTQESLTKLILNATSTAQRLISLQEKNSPLESKLKDLEQAHSDGIDQIKLLSAKNQALKDSKHELQLSANWYKERLMESQKAEKERFHAGEILSSRLSEALIREEKMNKSFQDIRLSVGRFVEQLTLIYNYHPSEIENLLGNKLRDWINFKDSSGDMHEEPFLGRKSTQVMSDRSREGHNYRAERFQSSRVGVRASKEDCHSIHTSRTDQQYAESDELELSSVSIYGTENGSCYQNPELADSDDMVGRHQVEEGRTHTSEYNIHESFDNHKKVQTQPYSSNNNTRHAGNVLKVESVKNIGTWGLRTTAKTTPVVWIPNPDGTPGSWNDVPTPPELLKKEKPIAEKYDCERVVKLTRLPVEITTAMVATFIRGGKIDDIRIIAAERNNSFKQAIITFCKPEAAAAFYNWVQEYPGSLVVDGLRCHAVLGLTIQPPAYDREVRVLILSSLPSEVNSINKLCAFVEHTAHDDAGHPFTVQDQKIYFNGGGSKSSASVIFDRIEGAIIMRKKWQAQWGMKIAWGRDECEGRLLDMDPHMKFFWFTQPKPSGHQHD